MSLPSYTFVVDFCSDPFNLNVVEMLLWTFNYI